MREERNEKWADRKEERKEKWADKKGKRDANKPEDVQSREGEVGSLEAGTLSLIHLLG